MKPSELILFEISVKKNMAIIHEYRAETCSNIERFNDQRYENNNLRQFQIVRRMNIFIKIF